MLVLFPFISSFDTFNASIGYRYALEMGSISTPHLHVTRCNVCGSVRCALYDWSKSSIAALIGLSVSTATFTTFPSGFVKPPSSFPCGWYGGAWLIVIPRFPRILRKRCYWKVIHCLPCVLLDSQNCCTYLPGLVTRASQQWI